MKLVKIFGIVMAVHAAAFMFIFAIPGCRSTKKPAVKNPTVAPALGDESPVHIADTDPIAYPIPEPAPVRYSPTRPNTPAAAEVVAQAAPATTTYTVVKGDSLWSIARKNGLTVKQLTAANNIRADATLKLGQKLLIPAKPSSTTSVAAPAATTPAPAAPAPTSTVTHVVKAGDTLGAIARKYQVKIGAIATANNIADPTKIRVGQQLKIPGARTTDSQTSDQPAKPAAPKFVPAPAPVITPAPVAPVPANTSPVFSSPVESAPSSEYDESPFIESMPDDTPIIRVEESGAYRLE